MYHFLNYRIDFDTPGSTIVQFKEFQKSKKKKKNKNKTVKFQYYIKIMHQMTMNIGSISFLNAH